MKHGRHVRGFTLLELLVVMGLLSAVMLAMGAALRTIAQSEDRIDHRLAQADEMRVANAFIRSALGRVSAREVPSSSPPGPLFAASADALAWVGVMPARYGQGGRHFFRLGIETVGAETALVLRFLPWTGATAGFPDWSQAEPLVLVRGAVALQVRYENARAVPSVWASEWNQTKYLPARVALSLQTSVGAWPDLVVALRELAGAETGPGRGGGVVGGSR